MNKKKKNILVWVFTWAGLLLAILYSPIGSPGLYKSDSNYAANQNIDFGGGSIENAKDLNFEIGNDYNELNVPDYNSGESSSKLSSGNYSYAASINDKTSSAGTSYSSSESQSYQNLKNTSSVGGTSGGGSSFISNNATGGSSASSAVTMNNGGIATLSAVTTISSSKTTQYTMNSGGQNPGGDPDPKTRIPVPDGWGFLLFLAVSYGIIKRKFFTV